MEELDLNDFLFYLKKYLWVLIIVPIVAALGILYYDTSVKTPRTALAVTKDTLAKTGAKVAGVIFNDIDRKIGHYYYGDYYGDKK